jgi:uncharacterized protein YdhG (YjbR/CyaY superfamily)
MTSDAKSPDEYIETAPEERREALAALRDVINDNIPDGFEETMGWGHMGWSVPHSLYPPGYHCAPEQPLPFIGLASQKNFIALYHMGLYGDPVLLAWFQDAWKQASTRKLDMGKSCIRFKKSEHIPFDLVGQLASKVTPAEWIQTYERNLTRAK